MSDLPVALAYAAVILILAGCCFYTRSVHDGHDEPVRAVVVRARWAWRCRGNPAITSERDPLEEWEREELITIRRGYKTAAPERTRT